MGIPKSTIYTLLKREQVAEFISEIVAARNLASQMYLPELLGRIIDDKLDKAQEEGIRDADLTRKDVIDIAKELSNMVKAQEKKKDEQEVDRFTALYQQINVIQQK
jgi:hypothetical protein